MRVLIIVLCLIQLILPQVICANEDERAESARLGSVTYNISVRFWQDAIYELTPDERDKEIAALSAREGKGELTPLEIYDLISLYSLNEQKEDEEKTISTLSAMIENILVANPKDHEALIARVKLSLRERNNDILFTLLADTTLADRTFRMLLIELSNLHFGLGNYAKAEQAIDYLLAADSMDTEALMTKASIRATALLFSIFTQRFEMLADEIAQAEQEERLPLTVQRINEEFEEIDFSFAERAMQEDPSSFEGNCFIGCVKGFVVYLHYLVLLTAQEEGDTFPRFTEETVPLLKDVKRSLERAMEEKPAGDIDVYTALAIHSLVMADYERARSYAESAIEARGDLDQSYDALITIINYQRQAVEEDIETACKESIEVLERKVKKKPLQLIDHLLLLRPMIEEGKYEEALSQLGPLEKEYPDELSVLLFKGGALLRMERIDESIAVLSDAILLDEQNVDILYNLGLAHMLKGSYGEAKGFLQTAYECDPSDEEVQSLLGEIEEKLK